MKKKEEILFKKVEELERNRKKELSKIPLTNIELYLRKNAKLKLSQHLIFEMFKIEQELKEYNIFLEYQFLKGGNPLISLKEKVDQKTFGEIRKNLKKENYHFPDILKMGEYVSIQKIPSKIFPENKFVTKTPLYLPIRDSGVAFLINPKFKNRINDILEMIGLKLMSSLPDGLVEVTVFDKAGAGQNFPHIARLHSKITEGKIVSDDYEIERMMQELKNNMKSIIQNISMNGFDSVEDYNKNTNEVPQRYNFIFISGFPSGFSKDAIENLIALIEEGYKAGIYIFLSINYDPIYGLRQTVSGGLTLERILKNLVIFEFSERPHEFITSGLIKENVEILKFPLKNEKEVKKVSNTIYKIDFETFDKNYYEYIMKDINEKIKNISLRPVIPITKIVPPKSEWWSKKASVGVSIPFAKKGIDNVYFSIGIDEYGESSPTHHGLIGGKTGSGKTVLIHDIILMASIYYPLDELEFWLLDYKEGTEFALYSDFPHVSILSMESEIEFGIDVLNKAINEISKRGALFKEIGVSNLAGYNKRMEELGKDKEKLTRILIFIDEFQVLLSRDNKTTEIVNQLLDDIVRRGRSFGINLFLATQTLKDITFKDSIKSNMPLRVALAMEKKDAAIILSPENTVAEFFQAPGEGVLNKSSGIPQFNVQFQAYLALDISEDKQYFSDVKQEIIDYANINYAYITEHMKNRFVYNGEVDVFINENKELNECLTNKTPLPENKIYLGLPAGLDTEHINIHFDNDFGENLLIVGPDIKRAASIIDVITSQLSINYQNGQIDIVNSNTILDQLFNNKVSDNVNYISNRDSLNWLQNLFNILKEREKKQNSSQNKLNFTEIFGILFFIENSKIFAEGGYSPVVKKVIEIIKNGPEFGIHLFIYSSEYTTISEYGLTTELSKFKKKIALYDAAQTSLKIFGSEPPLKFDKAQTSKEVKVAIIGTGDYHKPFLKFKPYTIKEINNLFDKEI